MNTLDEAIKFSVEIHSGQVRKLSKTPYILHPLEVMAIVGTMTADPEVLAAAVLHDTVEDTDATLQQIEEKFGKRVAFLVSAETENKRKNLSPSSTWKIRKEESLAALKQSDDIGVKMIWLGDKLSNMRSFFSLSLSGKNFYEGLNEKNPEEHKWYYSLIAEYLKELSNFPAYSEYISLIEKVFEGV